MNEPYLRPGCSLNNGQIIAAWESSNRSKIVKPFVVQGLKLFYERQTIKCVHFSISLN